MCKVSAVNRDKVGYIKASTENTFFLHILKPQWDCEFQSQDTYISLFDEIMQRRLGADTTLADAVPDKRRRVHYYDVQSTG